MSEHEGLFWTNRKYTDVHKSQNFDAVSIFKVISYVAMSAPFWARKRLKIFLSKNRKRSTEKLPKLPSMEG